MVDVFNTAIQCNTTLQIMGLLIIALFFISIAILIYKAIRFIAVCILKFHKVDATIDKGDFHSDIHLRQ